MEGMDTLVELNGERYLHLIALLIKDRHKWGHHVLKVLVFDIHAELLFQQLFFQRRQIFPLPVALFHHSLVIGFR
jgi:hypothetical protein